MSVPVALDLHFLRTAASMGWEALKEGRLSASPTRWMIDLRHLRRLMQTAPGGTVNGRTLQIAPVVQQRQRRRAEHDDAALAAFLHSGARLHFATVQDPLLSIVLVLFNRGELTFSCLSSIAAHVRQPFELVIVDNDSTDDTHALLDRVDGARVLRSGCNAGFVTAANAAASVARGKYLLFLNNDTMLLPGSVEHAVRTIEGAADIGAVGARLILPDGSLQEAGNIIWQDGTCQGYGRGDSPYAPQYSFQRDVDFCSGAFLLTPRDVFRHLAGFEEVYSPAYYEDVDYCVKLWKAGRRVVYAPSAIVVHVEFGSSSPETASRLQTERRSVFRDRHRAWLSAQRPSDPKEVLRARHRSNSELRILVFDDRVPEKRAGFGFPRAADLLKALAGLGHAVTLYPTAFVQGSDAIGDVPATVEVLAGYGPRRIAAFMKERRGYYDRIIVSRSHNLLLLKSKLGSPEQWSPGTPVIYDAEAISAWREAGRRGYAGERLDERRVAEMVRDEIELARGVDAVISVSDAERRQFLEHGFPAVHVVSFAFAPRPTPRSFAERGGFLFVGSFDELSPNADAVQWFVATVLPLIRRQLADAVRLVVVGRNAPPEIRRLQGNGVDLCSDVSDLTPFYDRARVFVAPTRFAAGVPYKVGHAAAHGVPVVCTTLLAGQLEWEHGVHLLAADTPERFAAACALAYSDTGIWERLRTGALERVAMEYAWETFTSGLRAAVEECRSESQPATMVSHRSYV